ncbi:MAG: sugar transferase [Candidatus Obscuribacterales bacterium]|nr:sugar transferase [Candidatus Obscuribacterales bacterium]
MPFKRITDIFLSATALVGFAPLLLFVALAIKADSSGPVIFRQKRVGRNGELFEIYKFRTMRQGTPDLATNEMQKLASPITKVGNILRKTSIDELPQLLNVLKGEMSLVGPRPALYNQTELTSLRSDAGVLEFLPGITGWAQINGRDELPDPVKVNLDKWYCDHWSYFLDWRIMYMTVAAVVSRRGAM